ncbi:amidoligase family protein [Actinokineospora xionganensis]|uniref:amidoligase family protein n=1 Tax=Actinokineospora xionganensis TaxID=2684470 RepID=UPI001C9C3152|nr:amidoligase family protein [Actinokineospora xionganensis]
MSNNIVDQVTCVRCGTSDLGDLDCLCVDGVVCDDCIERFYVKCDRCETRVKNTRSTDDGESVCDQCAWHFRECDDCEILTGCATSTAYGWWVCESCADSRYWGCDGCGELINEGDCCESCEESAEDSSEWIFDYSYKPIPEFHGEGPLFLGAELEIAVPSGDLHECADLAMSCLDELGYLKEDGSIGYGFEIVTHPMAYDWAIEQFPWAMLTKLREYGCYASVETGLHVHVSRAAFSSPCHVFRWMKFFYRNADRVTVIARRASNQWSRFDDDAREHVKDYAKGVRGDRYQAINTQNGDTFELRMFASSLEQQHVQAALALAAASVEYTRDLSVTDIARHGGWEWARFADWLADRPAYRPLLREMEERSCVC